MVNLKEKEKEKEIIEEKEIDEEKEIVEGKEEEKPKKNIVTKKIGIRRENTFSQVKKKPIIDDNENEHNENKTMDEKERNNTPKIKSKKDIKNVIIVDTNEDWEEGEEEEDEDNDLKKLDESIEIGYQREKTVKNMPKIRSSKMELLDFVTKDILTTTITGFEERQKDMVENLHNKLNKVDFEKLYKDLEHNLANSVNYIINLIRLTMLLKKYL